MIFAAVVDSKATALLKPDDFADRASIVALRHGEILLSNSQYEALDKQLSSGGSQGILQRHHWASGKRISQKNPGCPFFAILFYALGLLRITPPLLLSACLVGPLRRGEEVAGRMGRHLCGADLLLLRSRDHLRVTRHHARLHRCFAHRGGLRRTALGNARHRRPAPPQRRRLGGVAAFSSLKGAVFIRYTNVLELAIAVLAVLALARFCRLSSRTVGVWLATVILFAATVLSFDQWACGTDDGKKAAVRRDALVGAVLAAGGLGLWVLYLNYRWTMSQISGGQGANEAFTVHLIRFYPPAIGLIALLAAWLLTRLPRFLM